MKSRQSEPRGSQLRRKRNKNKAKLQPPVILMVVAALIVVTGLILLPRTSRASDLDPAQLRVGLQSNQQAGSSPAKPTMSIPVRSATVIMATAKGPQQPALNLTPVDKIQTSQIAGFENGVLPVIRFRDGSKLSVDPVMLGQLSAEVRLQMTYSQERK